MCMGIISCLVNVLLVCFEIDKKCHETCPGVVSHLAFLSVL